MHWSGKVYIWFALIGWIAALPLVSKLMSIRNEWAKQIAEVRKVNEANAEKLDGLEKESLALRSEYDATVRGWGQSWAEGKTFANLNPATGEMDIALGIDDGLGLPNPADGKPVSVHGFRPLPDGTTMYMGPYVVVGAVGNLSSKVEPLWKVRQGEIAGWGLQNGLTQLIWREHIPTSATVDIAAYYRQLHYNDEQLGKRRIDLQKETESLERHKVQLGQRMAELVGVPGGEPGLLDKIVSSEEARNAELAAVDDLRRRIAAEHARQEQLKADVAALERRLPGGSD